MKRDIKVGIKSDEEFFAEARDIARKLDTGWWLERLKVNNS